MKKEDYVYYKKGIIFNKAPHKEVQLSEKTRLDLINEHNVWFIRNTYDFDSSKSTSFWFVIKDTFGGMKELKRRTRNKVRHALTFFDIERISVDLMYEQGYDVYRDSFNRYSNTTDVVATRFSFLTELGNNKEGREFWGVIDKTDGTLAAYAENHCKEDMCDYFMLKARTKYLSGGYYPFYGLFYKMNEYYLDTCNLDYVLLGTRSATEHSNIQSFMLSKFCFRKAYSGLSLSYAPLLRLVVSILYPVRSFVPSLRMQTMLRLEAMARGEI
ncbi:hypothetical protein [uncultured Bacteroides sp.]|uniref:hypothetical protein n=1 Tax=uncultured Bacteroides sp. TaxID=162156 RepID=UPI002AABDD09|nr:hypothetical protein [uncultured Bacteroides sp.]